jgi:hypothetical protein
MNMKYIKYVRIVKTFNKNQEIKDFFDSLVEDGIEVIHYNEKNNNPTGSPADNHINITIFGGVINKGKQVL